MSSAERDAEAAAARDAERDAERYRAAERVGAGLPAMPRNNLPLTDYRTAIRDMTRLNQLFAILGEPAPLSVLVDRVLIALSELFAADVVALLQPAGPSELSIVGAIGVPEEMLDVPFSRAEGSHAATVMRRRAAVLVANGRADPRMDAQLRRLDVEAAVWLPVVGNQEVLAILVLARCEPVPFSRPDADLLMAMTYRIGVVLERTRAEEERRRLEARLRQAEKSESLARMAAAIAHHFNNKLTAVIGSLDLALDDLETGGDTRLDIRQAQEATRQASKVGQLMLAYLGKSFNPRETLDFVAICRAALPELTSLVPSRVRLRAELPQATLFVRASPVEIRQVLTNLVVNAGEAIGAEKGDILVAVREVPAARVVPSPLVAPGWIATADVYVCLEVSDTGSGMDADVLHNAFDPFFSTKFTGRGLGLPVVLGLIRSNEGTITVESERGKGSTFRVFLPLQPPGSRQSAAG